MKGIDIYQGECKNFKTGELKPIPEKAYKESDFVIVKATQGVSYKYTSFFHTMIKRALKDSKLIGAYHYASGHDPIKEADYFISVVKPYLGKIVLACDWEGYQNSKWGSKTWCTKFINRVKEKTGITCILYTGEDGCIQNKSLAGKVPLWFARYPRNPKMSTSWTVPKLNWNLGVWKNYDIWQYTSTNEKVDRNTTKWTKADWNNYAMGNYFPKHVIDDLEEYHAFIKKYYKKFINHYDSNMTTFEKCKAAVAKGKTVGLTCVVGLRWALAEMGIKNASGKSLISAPDGTFKSYYTGDMKKYLTRITSGGAVGMTIKQAADKGLLKMGDIICYEDHTHTTVYYKNYVVFEGGSQCVKNGHYPNGIKVNYEKYPRKISEILRWKTFNAPKKTTTTTTKTGKAYTGKIPTFPKSRSYYQLDDGIKTKTSYTPQITLIQLALNWAIDAKLATDGQYGSKTEAAVKKYQKKYGLEQDGKWGPKCNAKLKEIKK